MFANGLVEETQSLIETFGTDDLEVLKSLGYLQAVKYLRGSLSLQGAITECQMKTRHYAKRQMTWFRSDSAIKWINGFGSEYKIRDTALQLGREFALCPREDQDESRHFPNEGETLQS